MKILILLILTVMAAVEQAAPISGSNTTATTSAPITDTTSIDALKSKAKHEITSVLQEIQSLEAHNVRI